MIYPVILLKKVKCTSYLISSACWCWFCSNLGLLTVFSPVTRDQSVGGSYLGCEPMGLFWSLQPAPGGREGLRQVMRSGSLRDLTDGHLISSSISV